MVPILILGSCGDPSFSRYGAAFVGPHDGSADGPFVPVAVVIGVTDHGDDVDAGPDASATPGVSIRPGADQPWQRVLADTTRGDAIEVWWRPPDRALAEVGRPHPSRAASTSRRTTRSPPTTRPGRSGRGRVAPVQVAARRVQDRGMMPSSDQR